jgi:hypothetical protein
VNGCGKSRPQSNSMPRPFILLHVATLSTMSRPHALTDNLTLKTRHHVSSSKVLLRTVTFMLSAKSDHFGLKLVRTQNLVLTVLVDLKFGVGRSTKHADPIPASFAKFLPP